MVPGAHRRLSSGRQNPNTISSEKWPEPLFGQGRQSASLRAAPLRLSRARLTTLPPLPFQSDMQSWEEQSQGAIYTVEYACRYERPLQAGGLCSLAEVLWWKRSRGCLRFPDASLV